MMALLKHIGKLVGNCTLLVVLRSPCMLSTNNTRDA